MLVPIQNSGNSRKTAPSRKNLGDFSSYPAGLVNIRCDGHYKRDAPSVKKCFVVTWIDHFLASPVRPGKVQKFVTSGTPLNVYSRIHR